MKNLFNKFIFIFFLCFYCIFSNFSVFAYTNVPINEIIEKQNMPLNEDTEKQNISNNADITKQSSSTIPTTGSAAVIENNKKSPAEREFFTIETLEGNIFYIVIDKERIQDNVYFLSPVTEEELLSLTKTNTAKTNDTKENQKLEQQILQKLLSKNNETENQQANGINEENKTSEKQKINQQ